ncbi:Nn.00g104280.m01.CDS01 [Neocucurbitaria sp. VM-36]
MKALTRIRRSRTLGNAKAKTSSVVGCWPCPQKSVGRFIANIGNQSCWEAIGPARKAFLSLGQNIRQYLDTYSEPTSTWITWSIYMVGYAPETAVPTIIFCCEDETHRKRIRNTVRDSNILEGYAGIALKHLPRAPDYNQLVQLASSPDTEVIEKHPGQVSSPYGPVILSTSRHARIGCPLYIRMPSHFNAARKATAGGVIRIHGKQCLTTAAHAFAYSAINSSNSSQDEDLHFSDSDEDGETMSATSYSSEFSQPQDDDSLWSPTSSRSSSIVAPPLDKDATTSDEPASEGASDFTNPETEPNSRDHLVPRPDTASMIGKALFLSTEGLQPDLDYALIRLMEDSSGVSDDEDLESAKALVLPIPTTAEDFRHLKSTSVTAETASARTVSGHISATPVYLRIPNATTYQEVYYVKLKKALANGDCGSWVFDAGSGSLHGHIVAGSPDNGTAYIVPAYQIFDDIRWHLNTIKQRLDRLEQMNTIEPTCEEGVAEQHDTLTNPQATDFTSMKSLHKGKSVDGSILGRPGLSPIVEPLSSGPAKSTDTSPRGIASLEPAITIQEDSPAQNSLPKETQLEGDAYNLSAGSSSVQALRISQARSSFNQVTKMGMTIGGELTLQFRALLSQKRVQTLRDIKSHVAEHNVGVTGESSSQPKYDDDDRPPPLYFTIRNIPCVPTQPVDRKAMRFRALLLQLSAKPLEWENPGLLDEALRVVPLERIYKEAEEETLIFQAEAESLGSGWKAAWGHQDCVARALLRWFKRDFFTWTNNPLCDRCYSSTMPQGLVVPYPDERARGATKVELYRCTQIGCDTYTRFPRYSDAFVLMQTRHGRIGEWANCFSMLCRAIGCRVRYVWNAEDHVWTEVFSVHRNRWVHIDPCEEAWDSPLMYTNGWGKKLSYCIAFSVDGAEDVTTRYVRVPKYAAPRNRCSEPELLHIMDEIRAVRRQKLSKGDRLRVQREHMNEQLELRDIVIRALVTDLCSLSPQELADGSIGVTTEIRRSKEAQEALKFPGETNTPGIEQPNRDVH